MKSKPMYKNKELKEKTGKLTQDEYYRDSNGAIHSRKEKQNRSKKQRRKQKREFIMKMLKNIDKN